MGWRNGPTGAQGIQRETPSPAPGRREPQVTGQDGSKWLESSFGEKDVEILVDKKNHGSAWPKPTASLGCVIPLYLVLAGLDGVQFWAPQDKTDMDTLEEVQWRPPT